LFWLRSLTYRPVVNSSPTPLETAARAALEGKRGRTVVFEFEGQRYVIKRLAEKPRKLIQTLFMRWLVKRLTGQPLPLNTLALSEAAGSMDFEARRLQALAEAGQRVPHVALVTPEFFVLVHCGTVVATLLEKWNQDTWRNELPRLASELAEFHRAGHWHGGAQIKNVTLQNGVSYRIDFEENFGEFVPLPAAQAADLVLFLNSISLAGPIVEAEARQLLPQLLATYFAANPDPEVRRIIRRALPLLSRLASLAGLFERWSRKGIRRILILVDALRTVG